MTSAPGLSGERWDAFRKHRRETEQQLLKRQGLGEKHAANNQLRDAESRWSLPLELLAKEWLSELPENKTYVIERLLPTLILGMEKLLTEVKERGRVARLQSFVGCLIHNNLPTLHRYQIEGWRRQKIASMISILSISWANIS